MNQQLPAPMGQEHPTCPWPLQLSHYDRNPLLRAQERAALEAYLDAPPGRMSESIRAMLQRVLHPLDDVLVYVGFPPPTGHYYQTRRVVLIEMYHRDATFWAWSEEDWKEILGLEDCSFIQQQRWACDHGSVRRTLAALAYLFEGLCDPCLLSAVAEVGPLARKIFGCEALERARQDMTTILKSWGYRNEEPRRLATCIGYLLLQNRSPRLCDLSIEVLECASRSCSKSEVRSRLLRLSRALFAQGMIERALPARSATTPPIPTSQTDAGINESWLTWCQRWRQQSTQQGRDQIYYQLLAIGRWLYVCHPEITSPADFTYDLAAACVAAVSEMNVAEWSSAAYRSQLPSHRVGQPLRPRAKAQRLAALRTFLRDCQEWEWIPRHVNPVRAIQIPPAIQKQLGPDPRAVDKSLWAKILWAAMNLEEKDLPLCGKHTAPVYPLELVRALAVVWCFAALRVDEIVRLRVSCVRWQYEDVMIPETGEILPKDATCFLDIPVNKTMSAYTKPVHPLVGKRINEWQRLRPPEQPCLLDRKTSEQVPFLFCYRGRQIAKNYITSQLIPILCRKANIPEHDSRGQITSHRARATIASMLYNAKNPLDIFQLQKYLGHKQITSTQSYVRVDPTKLAQQVAKAGYLEQNLATIEVLLDQEAVRSGAAARGEPWKYYDLGHGYCLNDFWAECKHRMACARCPFYRPKESLADQLLEGQANLLRMLEFVQLTEEEKLLVTEGVELHQALIEQLADTPTPTGLTPREMETRPVGETAIIPLPTVRPNERKRQGQ